MFLRFTSLFYRSRKTRLGVYMGWGGAGVETKHIVEKTKIKFRGF